MIESFINEGKQKFEFNKKLEYGVSVTDSCIGFKETCEMISKLYKIL